MADMIPFTLLQIGQDTVQTVNARDIHHFLDIRKDYSSWIKAQIQRGHFIENRDYLIFTKKGEQENKLLTAIDYHFTFDAAKHIAMMSGAKKGWEVREYFLECERKLFAHPSKAALLHERPLHEQIESLRCAMEFLNETGMLDARDKLMFADLMRTEVRRQYVPGGVIEQKTLPAPSGFFLAERIRALGYAPTRKQEATLMSKGLARAIAQEYRQRHGGDPLKSQRFVDGAVRSVFWYREEEACWIDPIIQSWCARMEITT